MRKVTDEELQELRELQRIILELLTSTGELTIQERIIKQNLEENHKKFNDFSERERVLFEQLRTKYGTGEVNIETGEIAE